MENDRNFVESNSLRIYSLPLHPREAHLWYLFPDRLTDPTLLDAYQQLLCAEERQQYGRFPFEKTRHEYLVTRALVRTTLSRYVGIPPSIWRFDRNSYGKPTVAYPQETDPLVFSLSKTNGLIICLAALSWDVGVDIEDIGRPGETAEIADRFLSPTEVTVLRSLPQHAQRCRFFEYWTLKEAYVKARGMGLSIPLKQFSFHLDEDRPARISFDARLKDDSQMWQFAQFRPTSQHVAAAAIRRGLGQNLKIQVRQTIPLVY